MRQTSAIRKLWQSGNGVVITLSPQAQQTLGVQAGDGLYEVITDDRTIELQPLVPSPDGARRRRYLSNRVRALERARQRLRAEANASYQSGFNEGFGKGVEYGMRGIYLDWERVLPKLERFLEGAAADPSAHAPRQTPPSAGFPGPGHWGGGAHSLPAAPSLEAVPRRRRGR